LEAIFQPWMLQCYMYRRKRETVPVHPQNVTLQEIQQQQPPQQQYVSTIKSPVYDEISDQDQDYQTNETYAHPTVVPSGYTHLNVKPYLQLI